MAEKFPNNKNRNLYEDDRVWAAFYRDGKNLGEICKEFDCVVYELTPWLTKPLTKLMWMEKTSLPDEAEFL